MEQSCGDHAACAGRQSLMGTVAHQGELRPRSTFPWQEGPVQSQPGRILRHFRAGVEELVATDVRVVQNLVFVLEQFIDHHIIRSTRTIIDEFSRVIAEEMDFLHEADNVERFGDLFRNSEFVIIPRVYREATTTRVLVMQFFEGFRVTEVEEIVRHNIDTKLMIENLIEFYGDQLLVHGFFHADPHPGNILIRPDARIVLLDYGMVLEITPELRQDLVRFSLRVPKAVLVPLALRPQQFAFVKGPSPIERPPIDP